MVCNTSFVLHKISTVIAIVIAIIVKTSTGLTMDIWYTTWLEIVSVKC